MVSGAMTERAIIPRATYRLQLNHEFTFTQAIEIVPYLASLGISHCYLSPCLKARPGSMHGYDIVDHNSFNPEIGSAEDFDRLVRTLREHKMGLILDIVPNHMGVMGSDNIWWLDVLENGESSVYADFFDIDWEPLKDELHGKVLVPVLHDHYGAVLESGELKLTFHPERGEFDISYRNHRFPVDPKEYPRILEKCAPTIPDSEAVTSSAVLEYQSVTAAFRHLPGRRELSEERIAERNRDKEISKRRLAELCARSSEITACVGHAVRSINGDAGDPSSFEDLHELIKAQAFRLANWRVAADDINYRRFFDTNDLAGIRIENEKVFEATHRFVLGLASEGKVDGFRIDHPDGLYDPARYFDRLSRAIRTPGNDGKIREPYIVIEKILTSAEKLPATWAVSGTTGYDFANLVNGLFVDPAAMMRMERIYRNFTSDKVDFEDLAYRCKKLIIQVALASELNVLSNHIARIALSKRRTCDFTLNSLRDALTEVVADFPVYRTYITGSSVSESDIRYIRLAIAAAKWRSPAADTSIFDFVRDVLLTKIADGQDAAYKKAVSNFAMKFQQFTGPVMAKGVEDTAFYRYNRLVSLNDVGADLQRFGVQTSEFHSANQDRARSWPHTMVATSTHDSKQSEDARARIDSLSEMAGLWRLRVRQWKRFNRNHKRMVNDHAAPSTNDEYLLYQTLVGAWPSEPMANDHDREEFRNRIESYMLKAIREAKRHTSWINQNKEYESAVSSFVKSLLTPGPKNRFLGDFVLFQSRAARIGMWNSLSQTLLKLTCPGVPDIYQGTELWDFSLVDPDNRRAVDFHRRKQLFQQLGQSEPTIEALRSMLEAPSDGLLKLHLIRNTLRFRSQQPDLFRSGRYVPLAVEGAQSDHVVAFARTSGSSTAIVIAPRLIGTLLNDKDICPTGHEIWRETRIILPFGDEPRPYRNVLTGQWVEAGSFVDAADALAIFPVALLALDESTD